MTLHPQPLAPALAAAEAAGRTTVRLDLDGVRGKAELMRRCGGALRLPEWGGGNWDALADALRDLSWLAPEGGAGAGAGGAGWVVVVTSWEGYAGARPGEWETFVEVLEEAVAFWREGRGEAGLVVVLAAPESGCGPAAGAPPRTPRLKHRRG
ncbi:barstar family protein [Streptomyces sp. NRRL F-2664]|uniref:barstar family protein n=1 Tax=Streptomyces sp. NRRL F-2664 TaxID=1463842 RepID=UPI00068F2EFF|nr:barstar family protein [Streptomyces sp. NRRL F-2664]